MKKIIYSSIFAIALIMTGCSKEFLTARPTAFVSQKQVAEATELNPSLQNANIVGLYTTMITPGSGGTNLSHMDFGHKGWDIYGDILSGDMVVAGYTYRWYKSVCEYTATRDFTSTEAYMVWRFYYRLIAGANRVIASFGGNDAVLEDPVSTSIYGQAKAIRAFSYFYLAQYYGKGSYTAGQAILPIYTEVGQDAQPKSTAQEVYALITADLTQAVDLLADFQRTSENQINASVAKGLLAYAYAAMGDYAKVKTLTNEIITTSGFELMTADQLVGGLNGDFSAGGFNDVHTTPWMWGQDLTLANGLDLVSWWGQVDYYSYSYASFGDPKTININLYNKIPANDIRKQQFVDLNGTGQYFPSRKFYAPARVFRGQRDILTDYIYMRVEEMYLLNAEAAAQTGDDLTAQQRLIALLEIRVPDASYVNALTGQALKDEIYLQTRIELWGEGKSFLAFKRLEKTITLPPNHLSLAGETKSYDADGMTFDIPDAEVVNNPNF